ncbi:MAG: TRAP transporter substrate-binding protein DctP [Deltaproteobacteria bacterium]|nr:TRAP transporter substrate-binding protein DctP [Deltaproteobacteria bacterium]
MKKKGLFLVLITGLALAFAMPSSALAADKPIKWKVQGFVPSGMLYHDNIVMLAEQIKRVTSGRLIWQVFPGGALVPPFEGIKAVSDGVYQVNYGYTAQWVGKIPAAPLFTAAPGGLNTLGMMMWQNEGGGLELWQEMHDRYGFNVKVFPGGPISMESFMWSKKPLRKLEDFKGLKFRMMPLMGDVLAKHGFSVVFMPGGEIMPNLQRGVITAAEYSIPAFDKTLGIWEVCKYVMLPGIHQPASSTEILINKKAWKKLPDDLKVIVEAVIGKFRLDNYLWMEDKNLDAVDFFKEKGIEMVMMDPETISTFNKWAADYMDEMSAKDEFFAKVWKSQKDFGKRWYPYHKLYTLPHD